MFASSPIASVPADLTSLLHRTFGHTSFRANQQAVCEAAAAGQDVLLVMPTGAGKSLCYQLPAIARGGTALVISPLIALMDDQAAKLRALGLRVARIHSGLSRDDARQACRDYLAGALDFLFIAPERLRVPGFPEMLARRKPALVAIDEAHCISAWGHDFRPDYRTLGDHLPSLRPAPVIALTATATPTVQRDIVAQLNLQDPALFIHGFRRHNLAIEVVELSKPQRPEFVARLLTPDSARPAIVYAPSRKSAEELAGRLNTSLPKTPGAPGLASETRVHAYHAGLDPATRDRVQRHFLSGKTDVVVATIAFGMGIDKADVRTVIHTALPASVEAYYQEIGRAGRDGLPSRTVLLHGFADRKMHDFFLERDYPAAAELARVAKLLTPDFQPPGDLARRLKMDSETLANALSKLASQGAAALDFDGNVRSTGVTNWQKGYDAQLAFRRSQIDRMAAFAESPQCRMLALIQHFGDTSDSSKPCGQCDFCSPTSTTAQTFREPTPHEQRHLRSILRALETNSRSTGKLFTDLALTPDRKQFDSWLDALARAGYLTLASETFISRDDKNAGREITYKKATLTHEGRNPDPGDLPVTLRDTTATSETSTSRERKSSDVSSRPKRSEAEGPASLPPLSEAQQTLETHLRAWRKSEAARLGKPAFLILSDRTLLNIAIAAPRTLADLRRINGIGPEKSETYGPALIALCRDSQPQIALPQQASFSARPSPQMNFSTSSEARHTLHERERVSREDRRPLNYKTRAGRARGAEYDKAAWNRLDLEQDLRDFAEKQCIALNCSAALVLSEPALEELLERRPRTLDEIGRLTNLRGDLPKQFYSDLLSVCLAEYETKANRPSSPELAVRHMHVRSSPISRLSTEPVTNRPQPQPTPPPDTPLTPTQQTLDTSLRAWRAAEATRSGLPQFFILPASTLHAIVLQHPRNLADLRMIDGIGPEKADRHGPDILKICNDQTDD